jgi:dynein heavy chain 2
MLEELTASCHGSSDLTLAKIKSLILDAIHQIDVLNQLLLSKVKETSEWPWFKQLRYSRQGKNVVIDMANATFQYTFEYQGNAPKLVHTPLTDKCYLTLTQAMHMGFGGNPYGPAGTGKTESVKALGQAFARQVLVFNCDEGLDFHSMGRIFTGLVKCGAWGCFDEFNRLLEEQLSAISQQIQVIQEAIKLREKSMNLMGKVIDVNPNSGIFVTLNPAGKGYGGRSKLPDNLKQLFRPVAMSVPDNELIAEVLLFSEGFKTAKVLARKIIAVFTLSKQLLSKQQHYDWGLRALKTILTVAGRLIFE